MSLRLPEYPRKILKAAPLKEVICQIKFPPILTIGVAPPAQFQDAVRDSYPKLATDQQMIAAVPREGSPVEELVAAPAIWRFRDKEEAWTVSLATEFLALNTKRYTHFEEFSRRFQDVFQVTRKIYRLSSFTRIGLRYTNVLQADKETALGLWIKSLRPMYTATLTTDIIREGWLSSRHDVRIQQSDGIVSVKYGLQPVRPDSERFSFLLDFDYYDEGDLPLEPLTERLQTYNEVLYRLFRWSVGPPLFDSFEPQEA